MADQWVRLYHGTSTDPKWRVVAHKAETRCNAGSVSPGIVYAIWCHLLELASEGASRGRVESLDMETLAVAFGFDETVIEAVWWALHEKGLLDAEDRMVAWNKRNPKREDNSTERVRKWRERNATRDDPERPAALRNAVKREETLDEDEDTDADADNRRTDTDPPNGGSGVGLKVSQLHEVWTAELGGKAPHPKLNSKRRQVYRLLWDEQLKRQPDPLAVFRGVCEAVQRSEHHMSQRTYHLPESLFRNEERRERWVHEALKARDNGGPPSLDPTHPSFLEDFE